MRSKCPHYRFEHVRRLGSILHGRVHRHFAVVLSYRQFLLNKNKNIYLSFRAIQTYRFIEQFF
jgi:hypothetical protein